MKMTAPITLMTKTMPEAMRMATIWSKLSGSYHLSSLSLSLSMTIKVPFSSVVPSTPVPVPVDGLLGTAISVSSFVVVPLPSAEVLVLTASLSTT